MTSTTVPAAALSDGELAVIEARLHVSGLFVAHAHTDMTRLIAEVHRVHAQCTADRADCEGDTR